MTEQPNIQRASALLWAPIPAAARPRPKAATAWKTLDMDRELRLVADWHSGLKFYPAGTIFRVTKINSLGVILLEQGAKDCDTISWTREWKGTFTKVKRTAKRKAKKKTEDKP